MSEYTYYYDGADGPLVRMNTYLNKEQNCKV